MRGRGRRQAGSEQWKIICLETSEKLLVNRAWETHTTTRVTFSILFVVVGLCLLLRATHSYVWNHLQILWFRNCCVNFTTCTIEFSVTDLQRSSTAIYERAATLEFCQVTTSWDLSNPDFKFSAASLLLHRRSALITGHHRSRRALSVPLPPVDGVGTSVDFVIRRLGIFVSSDRRVCM